MFRQTLLVVTLGAALAAVYGTAAAQSPAKGKAGLSPACAANAPVKDYLVTVGEWDTVPKGRDGKPVAYNDRGFAREANSKLERYNFDPSVIIVNRGDCVNLRIHDVKGSHHNVMIEGTEIGSEGAPLIDDAGKVIGKAAARANPNAFEGPDKLKAGQFVRGEQVMVKFQANRPGTYRMICDVHTFIGPNGQLSGYDDKGKPVQGPMIAYITVLP